ncbi:hypothetical protein FD754_024542 [Muntiacus muntjak]|uniref:Prenylcysteine oxidase 1 n=1 Tax=Muntiacus muntjak TaxID=9888 RepID=A0A5N3UPB4_MUNMU|nr:hypothetical protein FD754_024542 [Muntiacus muntjak]
MGCFSGCLMSSASGQKFCEVCSAFRCSFDEFVGEKVVSQSYSSVILAPPPEMKCLNLKINELRMIRVNSKDSELPPEETEGKGGLVGTRPKETGKPLGVLGCCFPSLIYRYQSHDYAFSSVEKLLHSLGGDDYLGLFNRSLLETLQKAGFSEKFLDEIITPVMRVNYGQTTNINGFVGAVSMSCTDPGLWAVKGGNKLVCSRLLQASRSNLVSGLVMSIEEKTRTKETGNSSKVYEVVYQTGSETHSDFYDIVLVATPLNRKMSNINFLNFDPPIEEFHQHYEPLVTTLIKGELNSTVFSSRALNEFHLGTVLTTDNPDLFINSIGLVSPVEEDSNPQPKADIAHVWKIFSASPLSKEQILKLFVSYDYAVKQSWLAYPHYTPPEKCPSIILHDRLYYLNGIEFAASAMEMSAIAGYNAALLAYHRWNGNTHMIDQEDLYERLKTEL